MKELVPTNGRALPTKTEIDEQLNALAQSEDTQALLEVAQQAAAYQEYETRKNAKEQADRFGRIKILAEAHIGLIDIEKYLRPSDGALSLGVDVPYSARGDWRLLGAGLHRGRLGDELDALERSEVEGITTGSVVSGLRTLGVGWFDAAVFRRKRDERKAKRQRPWTFEDLATATGLGVTTVRSTLHPSRKVIRFSLAWRLARALEIDLTMLKPVPRAWGKRGKRKGRAMPKPRNLTGGRLDRAYSAVRKALQELDRAAGEEGRWGTGDAYEHLYRAEEIIGKAMKRAT